MNMPKRLERQLAMADAAGGAAAGWVAAAGAAPRVGVACERRFEKRMIWAA